MNGKMDGEWKDQCWVRREPTVGSGFAGDARTPENWLRQERDAELPSQSSQAVQSHP